MSSLDVTVAIAAQDALGESPFWDAGANTLTRVDFATGRVITWKESDAVIETARASVGFALPTNSGSVVVGSEHAILLLRKGTLSELADVPGTATVNDGIADPQGRVWFTTYARDGEPVADLWRLDGNHCTPAGLRLRGPNGLAWSPDAKTLYVIESQAHELLALDYDVASGSLSSIRTLHTFDPAAGTPDGMAVDENGDVWVAVLGPGQLRSFAPDGTPKRIEQLPVTRATNLAFVGDGAAWVTTARTRLDPRQLQDQPWAGSVLSVRLGVNGAPTFLATPP